MNLAFSHGEAEVFVPDGSDAIAALARTTHLGIGAHQDDLEIMAAHGIFSCLGREDAFFSGVVVCDGAGSSRAGRYAEKSDAELARIRRHEQRKAAVIGEYAAQVQLAFPSASVKAVHGSEHEALLADLEKVLTLTRPRVLYTHNPADKHDTHVAVMLRVVAACRRLPREARPERIIGCEVWRDLDWLCDSDKVLMALDEREGLQAALLGVFDSQVSGGKRYDLATLGRRRAHATFSESHESDRHTALVYGMDLTALLDSATPKSLLVELIRRFQAEVNARLERLGE
ncbi:MAG: PIG-L deacetylase family protein [Myxococcota bacterium]